MRLAAEETSKVGSAAEKLAQQRQALETVGRTMFGAGIALGAGLTVAVAKAAEFDQAMSFVQAATHESASNMVLLRDAALDAGAVTAFSASEAANAIEELAKAGISTKDILGGGLMGAMRLAEAGGLGVAEAAGIAATTMQQFSLRGTEAEHVADLLAAGAGKAMGDVTDLSQALNQAGLIANQFDISVEETVGTLSAFASAGMLGSDAGTSMRAMLLRLANPTDEVKKLMKDLGINTYDSQGRFIGLAGLAGQLGGALGGLTDQQKQTNLAMIFGQDAIRGASILLKEGEQGIRDWTDAVDDQGYAVKTAQIRMDNLAGDVEKLGGAFDTALIKGGTGANDVLRDMVQIATLVVDGVGGMPQPLMDAGFAVGTVAAAILLTGGVAMTSVPKVVAFRDSVNALGISGRGAAAGVAALGAATGVATVIVSMFMARMADEKGFADSFKDSLDQATGALTDYSRELVAKRLVELGAFDAAAEAGIKQDELTDAILEGGDALQDVRGKILDYANTAGVDGVRAGKLLTDSIFSVSGGVEAGTAAFEDMDAATKGATSSTDENARALKSLEGAAARTEASVDGLSDSIRNFGVLVLDTRDAERQFEESIDDVAEALERNGVTLDIGTAAGRDNQAVLDDMVRSTLDYAAAVYDRTGSEEEARKVLELGRAEVEKAAVGFGVAGDAVGGYVDELGLIPANISTFLDLNVSLKSLNNWRPSDFSYDPKSNRDGGFHDHVQAFADGGEGMYTAGSRPLFKFAEPETGWETFISGRKGKERDNFGYAFESMMRLGSQLGLSMAPGPSSVDNSVNVDATVITQDPRVAVDLLQQQLGSYMAVRPRV